jgi:AraC family transcriptional regulator of adaptative response/methylated-DNA-[protein]-cysteine methyltransferase
MSVVTEREATGVHDDSSHTLLDESAAWSAVVARDRGADGRFVFAVRTTGIYCRPSCPARRPRREHVDFFAGPEAAEAAGYRACRRCHPRAEITAPEAAVARAREYLEAHVGEAVTLEVLAGVAGLSPHHLQRTFKRMVGVSPSRYAAALRAERMKSELRRGGTVSRALFDAGYGASSRAYDAADMHLGMTPAAYRRGGLGAHLGYTITATELGTLLVAATERGVCSVMLGDDAAALEAALEDEYPNATRERVELTGSGPGNELREWTESIAQHLEGRNADLAVPADVQGTAFQERVWRELRTIPYGETRSYTEIAAAAGAPRAVRAVASACARNRLALVIPCHRVVREGGALGGYRWGVERKRRILAKEHAIAARVVGRG